MLTVRRHPLLCLQVALDFQRSWEMLREPLRAMYLALTGIRHFTVSLTNDLLRWWETLLGPPRASEFCGWVGGRYALCAK
jgi:hypothetical protein